MSESIDHNRRHFFGAAAMTIAAAQLGMLGCAKAQSAQTARLPFEANLPSLSGATAWLNSPPLTPSDLRGSVVLINFWTYTCVNWRRTLPYTRAWSDKYKDHRLVVIGVHTSEFSFGHNIANIRWAMKDMEINYPVAVDSDYAIWHAFNNEYWPAFYFADARGRIRHHQFGEGDYQQSERVIQELLAEAGFRGISHDLVSVAPRGAEVAADLDNLRSSENYVGYEQTANFVSSTGTRPNKPHDYAYPAQLGLNHWALQGNWTIGKEAIALNQAAGRIAYRFHSSDLNLVKGPAAQGTSVRFRVNIDGQPPDRAHGFDVDAQGNGSVVEQRLY